MTNRLELNWKVDGFIDEQRYYCSETPIDPENLPLPKAVLAGDVRNYIYTDVVQGNTYYTCLSSVRGDTEKVGGVVKQYAIPTSFFKINSDFNLDFVDKAGNTWTKYGQSSISSGWLNLDGNGDYLTTAIGSLNLTHLNDVTIRFSLLWGGNNSSSSAVQAVLSARQQVSGASRSYEILVTSTGVSLSGYMASSAYFGVVAAPVDIGVECEISFERKNMVWHTYKDGHLVGTATQPAAFVSSSGLFYVGRTGNAAFHPQRDFFGKLKALQLIEMAVGGGGATTSRI